MLGPACTSGLENTSYIALHFCVFGFALITSVIHNSMKCSNSNNYSSQYAQFPALVSNIVIKFGFYIVILPMLSTHPANIAVNLSTHR